MVIVYHIMGDLSIGKLHKDLIWKLCNLLVYRKTARVGRVRAVRKIEKTPTTRSRSLIKKGGKHSEMLVRMVGVEPDLITIKNRVPDR